MPRGRGPGRAEPWTGSLVRGSAGRQVCLLTVPKRDPRGRASRTGQAAGSLVNGLLLLLEGDFGSSWEKSPAHAQGWQQKHLVQQGVPRGGEQYNNKEIKAEKYSQAAQGASANRTGGEKLPGPSLCQSEQQPCRPLGPGLASTMRPPVRGLRALESHARVGHGV